MVKKASVKQDLHRKAVLEGWQQVVAHPLFKPLASFANPSFSSAVPSNGWAFLDNFGRPVVHPKRQATAQQWAWVFSHLLLHAGFGHNLASQRKALEAACGFSATFSAKAVADFAQCTVVCRFQQSITVGIRPPDFIVPAVFPSGSEQTIVATWVAKGGVPSEFCALGVAGSEGDVELAHRDSSRWQQGFADGLAASVSAAVEVAAGVRQSLSSPGVVKKQWDLARDWFVSSYPLLGAVFSTLKLVSDADVVRSLGVDVAAVDASAGEVYINPHAGLSSLEWRFVLAHEALHAALSHQARIQGRDPLLFNIAADFVVNSWLVKMKVGQMPSGLLLDPQFEGMSAEQVYDIIVTERRKYAKLATLRGPGCTDIVDRGARSVDGVGLDDLLRRSLVTGLESHLATDRGFLPAGLVKEIRALSAPAPAWDVELGKWFAEMLPLPEHRRTYARASRRQASTPAIPRPGRQRMKDEVFQHTFGVILDTSGSMPLPLLGKALGAVSAYALSREVLGVRVVFCDAAPYDAGFLEPSEIASRVSIKGGGGTVLAPAVRLLEKAADFPHDAPVLVITDGGTDSFRIHREHAFILPYGASLPFKPTGPVFRMK